MGHVNEVIEVLGFYGVQAQMDLLESLKAFSFAILFLGLIFAIIIIMFAIEATLLIYSLLMISVERNSSTNGVMRVLGLSKTGFVLSIFLQALMFVLPSIVLAFVMVVPSLTAMYKVLFTEE